MSEEPVTLQGGTAIEWADYTFNPWWGCTKIPGSPACVHCYAADWARRFGVGWGDGAERRPASEKTWGDPARWDRKAAKDGVRRRVFCLSMGDVFEARPDLDEHRARLWNLIEATPNLDWLLLTKRPEHVLSMVPWHWVDPVRSFRRDGSVEWPANVWVGCTVENQRWADERIPHLLDIPAPVRFLSVEPMAEAIYLRLGMGMRHEGINWVICGGESGPKAKPMHPSWPRDLRDQCAAANVPFLFKQWGEWAPDPHYGDTYSLYTNDEIGTLIPFQKVGASTIRRVPPSDARFFAAVHDVHTSRRIARLGKKNAGRTLDGITHDGYPEPVR